MAVTYPFHPRLLRAGWQQHGGCERDVPRPVITDYPYKAQGLITAGTLTNDWLVFMPKGSAPADSTWGDSAPCVPNGSSSYTLAIYVTAISAGTADVLIKSSDADINPTDGDDLFDLWDGTVGTPDPIGTYELALGWNFIDFSLLNYTDAAGLINIATHGLMIGFDETSATITNGTAKLEIGLMLMFRHYEFGLNDTVSDYPWTLDPQIDRPTIDDRIYSELKNKLSPDSSLYSEIELSWEADGGGVIDVTPLLGGSFLNGSVNIEEPWSLGSQKSSIRCNIPSTVVTELLADRAEAGIILPSNLANATLYGKLYSKNGIICRNSQTTLSYGTGDVTSASIKGDFIELGFESALSKLSGVPFWNNYVWPFPTVGSPGTGVGWAANPGILYITFHCLTASTPFFRMQALYPADWVWLAKRYAHMFVGVDVDEMQTGWDGGLYGEVVQWGFKMYGLFSAITSDGKSLIYHPAVYRPSMRVHYLDLDTETTDGAKISPQTAEGSGGIKIVGTDTSALDWETIIPAAPEYITDASDIKEISPVNTSGVCPLTAFNSLMVRESLARQYAQYMGPDVLKLVFGLGKVGALYNVGDQIILTSERYWPGTTKTFMVSHTNKKAGGTKADIEAVKFSNWQAGHSTFLKPGPLALYRGAYGINKTNTVTNRTWRGDGEEWGALTQSGANTIHFDDTQGSWQGTGWSIENAYTGSEALYINKQPPYTANPTGTTELDIAFAIHPASGWTSGMGRVIVHWVDTTTNNGLLVVVMNGDTATQYGRKTQVHVTWTTDFTDPFNTSLWAADFVTIYNGGAGITTANTDINMAISITLDARSMDVYSNGIFQGTVTTTSRLDNVWRLAWRGYYGAAHAMVSNSFLQVDGRLLTDPRTVNERINMSGRDIYYP